METIIVTVRWIRFILGLILPPAILLLIVLTVIHPPLFNASGNPLSDESVEIVRYVSDGNFNFRTSIFPIAVVVTENSPALLRWRTYYGIYGSTEHIWDTINECYECTDRLWD